jgi:hypothetical protein
LAITCSFVFSLALSPPIQANGSDLELTATSFTGTSATFVAKAIQPAALNVNLTSGACYLKPDNQLLGYLGNSHTFTALGEEHQFKVEIPAGAFPSGAQVALFLSDSPGTVICGFDDVGLKKTVTFRYLIPVPTMTGYASLVLALMLLLVGRKALARKMSA